MLGTFDFEEPLLKSPSSSVVASAEDSVNCNDEENVGEDNANITWWNICWKAAIKRNCQVKTLADLIPGVNIQRKINIDTTILFNRLIALGQLDENI